METLKTLWAFYSAHQDTILMIIFYVLSVGSILVSAIRKQLSAKEALLLIINTLKDENQMTSGGATFKEDVITKVDKVATVMQVSSQAVTDVKAAITTANTRDTTTANPGDLKLGSYKGKPIFLSDATGIGSKLFSALQVVKGIIGK